MLKITVLYGHPTDPAEFERYYKEVHLPLADKMEGISRKEHGRFLPNPDGSKPTYYRIYEAWFESAQTMQETFGSPAGQAAAADLPNFATGGVSIHVSEIQED